MAKGSLKTSTKPAKAAPVVKDGRVTKPAQTPVAKSKDTAKKVAANTLKDKSDKKSRKVKEPTPESDSESDSDASGSEGSDSGDDSGSSISASDVEDAGAAKPKINGAAKPAADSDDESSEEDSDKEPAKTASAPPKINGASKPAADADSDDSSDEESDEEPTAATKTSKDATGGAEEDDTSDESDSSDDEAPAKAGGVKVNGAARKAEASDDEDSDISSSDDSDEEEEEKAPPKKRKADEPVTPAAKKSKTAEPSSGATGNLFVGNLSWNVDEEWLAREFEGFGEITGCRVITDRDSGRSKGFGYVEFADAADAEKALEGMSGNMVDGREIRIDFSTPRTPKDSNTPQQRAQRYGDTKNNPSDTLFLGNLSFDCDNDTVSEAFESFGTITRVSLPTDRDTGNPKGFGYVSYSSVEEAQAAMDAMMGADIAGRPVRIDFAGPRPDNAGSGGRGGRGGFGGGRGGGGFGGGRGRGGFGDRGGRGGGRGGGFRGRGTGANTTNRGGFGDFKGRKMTF